jgi:hypothetical protein
MIVGTEEFGQRKQMFNVDFRDICSRRDNFRRVYMDEDGIDMYEAE